MRRRYRINYDRSPKTLRYLEIWDWDEEKRVALVYGDSQFDTIQRARFVSAALNICQGLSVDELESLPPGILRVLLRKIHPHDVVEVQTKRT